MLVAQNEENEYIILNSHIPRKTLLELKKSSQFFCPQCKGKLLLKIGNIKIPHFAHHPKHHCEQTFSEKESYKHLLGKEQLYCFFKKQKGTTQIEPYLKKIQQRPDLLFTTKKETYAIEFQCSPIDDKLFTSRNEGYISIGIKPIWIPLNFENIKTKKHITKLSIPIRFRKFMQHDENNSYFVTYNPMEKQFVYMTNLLHLYGNTFLSKIVPLSIMKQQFPFFIPKKLTKNEFFHYLKTYNIVKETYLHSRIFFSKKGVNDLFLRSVYELRLSITELPIFLGVPIKGNEQLSFFSVEWQTALFYFMEMQKITPFEMDGQAITQFLKWAQFIQSKNGKRVVETYCHLLKELNIQHIFTPVSEEKLNEVLFRLFLAFNWKS